MAIQTWVVEIYDADAAGPAWRSRGLDFNGVTAVVKEVLQRRAGEIFKVRTPLNAKEEELKTLHDLGVLLLLPPE
ncbi:MAG: hypothetical protein WDN46_15785 [Methylocella sp.]